MKGRALFLIFPLLCGASQCCFAQSQIRYFGTNATGQLTLAREVNLYEQSLPQKGAVALRAFQAKARSTQEQPKALPRVLHPPLRPSIHPLGAVRALGAAPQPQLLTVLTAAATTQFNALSHLDQRNANNGNQFSVEPPSPSVAATNGYVLEGVNNAVQVYDGSGSPLLPAVVSTNQLFGVPAAINRDTGVNGVFPTDMRVFYDPDIQRWFVLQRAADNDAAGNPLPSSHLYLAVSQSSDPTGTYNIYTADTTDSANPGCPCLLDYPQIGADRYGFYISGNEFDITGTTFLGVKILALSKASIATGSQSPTAFNFSIPFDTGFEFAVQPATTPPGASYYLGNGGQEYFASTLGNSASGDSVAIWALTNTSSLATSQPNPQLVMTSVPTLSYSYPDPAQQPDGPHPYGESLNPLVGVPQLDGGDTRALSLSYAAGQLYLTLATAASDGTNSVVGGLYVVLSPTLRLSTLAAAVRKQGYLIVKNNDLLRPAIAVNAQGNGAIAATLVGPDRFPSAAFIPFDGSSTPSTVQVARSGDLPEDGFTGYTDSGDATVARWGDYSTAVGAGDGTIWMATEYIADLPRTDFANWNTFLMRTVPK